MDWCLFMVKARCTETSNRKTVVSKCTHESYWLSVLYLQTSKGRLWKIADFGLTSEGDSELLRTTESSRGTQGYRAPELIRDGKTGYNNKVDIWSLGCILHELAIGERPFPDDWSLLRFIHSSKPLKFLNWTHGFSSKWEVVLSRLINDMLSLEPNNRPRLSYLQRRFAFHYEVQPLVENYCDPLHYRPATLIAKPLFPTNLFKTLKDITGPTMDLRMTSNEKR